MTLSQAFAFLDERCRFWSLTARAASCSYETPRPKSRAEAQGWEPFIRTSVRRAKGEALEAMLVRCAAKAAERQAASWRSCQGCGGTQGVQKAERLGLALCSSCRAGLGRPSGAGRPWRPEAADPLKPSRVLGFRPVSEE